MTIPASENVQPDETDRVPISQKQSDSCREVIEPLPESERAGHEPSRLTMSATPLSSWLKNSTGAEAFAEKPDFASAIKALEAIAHEKQTETLLAQLLKIMMECAGAERSLLILESAGEAFIHATASPGRTEIYLHDPVPLAQADNVPTSIVNYVRQTAGNVILTDAREDNSFSHDRFIQDHQPRSVMCVPIISHGKFAGVLYLENNQRSGAFTAERIQVLQLLAAQAAIALENARLYDEMRREAAQRTQAEKALRSITEGTAAATGGDFFASLVQHLAASIPVRIAFVTECANPERSRARTLAFWDGAKLTETIEYDVKQTTCEKVYRGETCFYPSEIQKLFPEEPALVDLNGQSYIGLPIQNSSGELIGHLAVLDDQPMDEPRGFDILKIFAARAGAELERTHAEAKLRAALNEVERLKNQLHAENIYLQEEIRREHNFEEIVGSSPALLRVLEQIERVAPTDVTVLISGETGTGKELIARAIHDRSPRRHRPLVKVNCGAISAGLVESELFGHVKGAFTGAFDKRTGRFELADGGTLFLDEVGELPLDTQVKLLRVLQEGEFEPVGSSKTVRVNVRIITATNRNLADEVSAGRFRADLFYRLNVLPLHNPPLRERREDIAPLAMFFLSRFARRFGRNVNGITQDTMNLLLQYNWPGNIRELQNLIERAVVLSNNSTLTIDRHLLPAANTSADQPAQPTEFTPAITAPATQPASSPTTASSFAPSASLEDLQRQHILNILTQTNWIIEGDHGAARLLNLHPNTLRSRLKKMGIQRPKA